MITRVVSLVAVAAVLLTGCVGHGGQTIDNLGGVRFWQVQAVPGFDDSSYTLNDEQVAAFTDLLTAHDVDPTDYRTVETEGCTGGITTRVQTWYHGAGDGREMIIDGCAAEDGTFEAEATEFFSAIRGGVASPHNQITALTFSQSQAVLDFDDGTYTQHEPAEIQRFADLLELYAIVPIDFFADHPAEPCPGSISTEVTVTYLESEIAPVMSIDSCTPDDGFSADATALFTEWREALG